MKTDENLQEAFAGESQARNKYEFFAKVARKEGYGYIADIFERTALDEVQHAKESFKRIKGIGSTVDNLQKAIDGESYEEKEMYPTFAKTAREEGREDIAKLFEEIAEVERKHEARFTRLLKLLQEDKVFKRDEEISWRCSKCGHIHHGTEAPDRCSCCNHPQEYFLPEDMWDTE